MSLESFLTGAALAFLWLGIYLLIRWFFNVIRRPKIKEERTPPDYAKRFTVYENPTLFTRSSVDLRKYCFNQTNKRLPIDDRLADAEKIYNYLSKRTEPWKE